MPSVIVIEHMAKRERTLPIRIYRVAERQIIEKPNGQTKMLKDRWEKLKDNLTRSGALQELHSERLRRAGMKQDMRLG